MHISETKAGEVQEEQNGAETADISNGENTDNKSVQMSPKVVGKIELTGDNSEVDISGVANDKNLYNIKITGTHDLNYYLGILTNATIKKVKEQEEKDYVEIIRNPAVRQVCDKDIIDEIERRARAKSPYENIKKSDATEIVSLINTGMFYEMFNLHSAMRIIDRYVDFDNTQVPLEKQCITVMKTLKTAIKESFKQGVKTEPFVTMIKDKKTQENISFYSSKLYIKPSELSKEIQDVLGTETIAITFGRPKGDHPSKGIICTLFTEGV